MTRDEERAIEWECQKLVRQYYYHVDHYEYEQAVALFTLDVDWLGLGVKLDGREEILEGLYGGLGAGTIRHVMTNIVVNVVDEDHAESRAYGISLAVHSTARPTSATINTKVQSPSRDRDRSWMGGTNLPGRTRAGASPSAAGRLCSSAIRTSRCRSIPGPTRKVKWRNAADDGSSDPTSGVVSGGDHASRVYVAVGHQIRRNVTADRNH